MSMRYPGTTHIDLKRRQPVDGAHALLNPISGRTLMLFISSRSGYLGDYTLKGNEFTRTSYLALWPHFFALSPSFQMSISPLSLRSKWTSWFLYISWHSGPRGETCINSSCACMLSVDSGSHSETPDQPLRRYQRICVHMQAR